MVSALVLSVIVRAQPCRLRLRVVTTAAANIPVRGRQLL